MLADAATMISNGSTAPTLANAINPNNAIQDISGLQVNYQVKLKEMKTLLTLMKSVTDNSDPNLTLLNNGLTAIG